MSFGHTYLRRIMHGANKAERARANALPDRLTPVDIAWLACEMDSLSHEDHHAVPDGESLCELIAYEAMAIKLSEECERGGIPAHHCEQGFPRSPVTGSLWNSPAAHWHIHRDDARRYFQRLDMMPAEGSALECWLRERPEKRPQRESYAQQDKADFQKLCLDHWVISPTTTIRGDQGIVRTIGRAYLHQYTEDTLEKWASAVAPEHVKKPGRPRKNPR